MSTAILWPILAHIGLIFVLYAWLSYVRIQAVRMGRVQYGCFEFGRDEPSDIARITRNLGNQFELPVIAYAAVLLLMQFGALGAWDVAFAWVFFAGRVIHTGVQTLTDDVPLRGRVFTINFLACAALAGHLALVALSAV